jgi:hypothetical protein
MEPQQRESAVYRLCLVTGTANEKLILAQTFFRSIIAARGA